MDIKSFRIDFPEEQIEELRRRIGCARFPKTGNAEGWRFGTDENYLMELTDYWRSDYDWFRTQRRLNSYPQYTVDLGEFNAHFFHIRGARKGATPLLLTHGWPDSFLRYIKVIPYLSDYDVIIPSLPGFAFSTLPPKGYANNADVAEAWHKLMTEALGYKEYIASGGDMGRGVTCYLAARYPQEVKGIHLTDVGLVRELITSKDADLTPKELEYKRRATEWQIYEGAYIGIHGTKPQTLAYSLSDSPVGMAAWIVEKYRAWSDWQLLTKDDLCDCLTLYWLTNTACTSIRAYHGNSFTLPPLGEITAPTAISAFPYDVLPAPREWIERNYPVIKYDEMERGGHFTALEQPERFARSLIEFAEMLCNDK